MSKQAIALLVHKDAGQVNLLITLLKDHFDIYVHIDKKSDLPPAAIDSNRVWKTFPVHWGGFDMVQATFFLYRKIIDSGQAYTHIILLSGDTLPVKPPSDIAAFLFQHPEDSFMENVAADRLHLDRRRYIWYNGDFMRSEKGIQKLKNPFRTIRAVQKILNLKRSTRGFERTGSQWTILSLPHARHLVQNCTLESYRFVAVPDECVVQNHFTNYGLPYLDNLIYAHWPPNRDRSPGFIDEATMRALVKQPYLFARKFRTVAEDPGIARVVGELTNTVLIN